MGLTTIDWDTVNASCFIPDNVIDHKVANLLMEKYEKRRIHRRVEEEMKTEIKSRITERKEMLSG